MSNTDYLILGDGLLGSELRKQTGWEYISRKKDGIDFNNIDSYSITLGHGYKERKTVINCIANTNTYSKDKYRLLKTNYWSVMNLVDRCNMYHTKLVQISTDYVYAGNKPYAKETDLPIPAQNWYTYSKLLADEYIRARAEKWLIIRTSFKATPFPYKKAFVNQYGNFDYVNIITMLIKSLIENDARGIYNVGTEEKSMYTLALRTNTAVEPTRRLIDETTPRDIRMNLTKMNKFLIEKELERIKKIRMEE